MNKFASNEALLSIAVAGLLAGALGTGCSSKEEPKAPAASATANVDAAAMGLPKHACKTMNECKGQGGCSAGAGAGKNSCKGQGGCATVAHHSCSSKNECKALGGCSSGDNGCAGKNSCKGKGGCSVPVMH